MKIKSNYKKAKLGGIPLLKHQIIPCGKAYTRKSKHKSKEY